MRLPRPLQVETLVSSVSYLPQPGKEKIKMFSHDFEGFHLKKQNVEVKKGIGLCSGAPNENIVQNHISIALLNVV